MTINEKQDALIETFELFDEPLDKTQYIIDLGKKLPPLAEAYCTEENLIRGCQSKVWLHTDKEGSTVVFEADAEPTAQISKGLISMLIHLLSGHTPQEIVEAELYFIEKIGMSSLVTSRRAGGLAAMIARMKEYSAQQLAVH
jgi:cysteine desulfuration protein SufE